MKHEQEKPQEQTLVPDVKESSKPSSGEFVIVDRVNKPLKAVLDAYNSHITPQIEIPKKLKEYPSPKEEKEQLAAYQQLIQDTQAEIEGPPIDLHQRSIFQRPDLETIPKVSSIGEPRKHWQEPMFLERIRDTETRIDGSPKPTQLESVLRRIDLETIPEESSTLEQEESICEPFFLEQIIPYTKIQQPNQQELIMKEPSIQEFLRKQNVKQTIGLEGIPEMDERMAREMWETFHQKAIEEWTDSNNSPPITKIEMEPPDWDKQPLLENSGEELSKSKDELLSEDSQPKQSEPSYLGEYIDQAATLYVPSMRKQNGNQRKPPNLQTALSTQINCKLTLRELTKAQPKI